MPSVFSGGKGNGNPGFVHTFSRIAPTYEEKYGTKLSQAHDESANVQPMGVHLEPGACSGHRLWYRRTDRTHVR